MKRAFTVIAAIGLVAVGISGCKSAIKENVRKNVQAIWNDGKVELIEEGYTAAAGKKVRAFYDQVKAAYPDFKIEIEEIAADGNVLYTRWSATGTHAKYEKKVQFDGVSYARLEGRKVSEELVFWDRDAEYKQLGYTILPPDMEKKADEPKPPASAAVDDAPVDAPAKE
jgi:hypothetical protein